MKFFIELSRLMEMKPVVLSAVLICIVVGVIVRSLTKSLIKVTIIVTITALVLIYLINSFEQLPYLKVFAGGAL